MKKLLQPGFSGVLFLLLNTFNVFAGGNGFAGFFGGYNGAFGSYSGFNKTIDYYNERRPQLTHKLENVKYMQGACFGMSLNIHGLYGEAQWTGRHANIYSQAMENGKLMQRDIKYRNNTFHIALGAMTYKSDPLYIGIAAGMDFGDAPIMTRKYAVDTDDKPDYTTVPFTNISLAFSGNMPVILRFSPFAAIMVKPYYIFYAWEHNYYDLHEYLDPGPSGVLEPDEHEFKSFPNHFGIQTSLFIGGLM